jgi:hypothetical protein
MGWKFHVSIIESLCPRDAPPSIKSVMDEEAKEEPVEDPLK